MSLARQTWRSPGIWAFAAAGVVIGLVATLSLGVNLVESSVVNPWLRAHPPLWLALDVLAFPGMVTSMLLAQFFATSYAASVVGVVIGQAIGYALVGAMLQVLARWYCRHRRPQLTRDPPRRTIDNEVVD